jgi:Cellulase (glycosyl hydrolase family 5)/Ca-dependent carbohydrate-binding module xylan-binding
MGDAMPLRARRLPSNALTRGPLTLLRGLAWARRGGAPAVVSGFLCLAATALPGPAAAASTTVTVAEAENGRLDSWYMRTVADASASNGSAVRYDWPGSVRLKLMLPADADTITLRVRGDQCGGAPAYALTIDNAPVAGDTVASTAWTDRTYTAPLVAGTHSIDVRYTNDHTEPWPNACDRNLYLDAVTFSATESLSRNPPVPDGFVHQSGTQLLDGANRPLRLRGVNLGGWLLWEGWVWGQGFDYIGESAMMRNLSSLVGPAQAEQFRSDVRANYVSGSDFKAMSAYGLNVARVLFNYRLLEDDGQPFVYKQSGWDVLDRLVSDAKQADVYLVLDMQAAPCSQMYAFISDYVGPDFLWSSAQCQDRMAALWKAIAARYTHQNVVAGYDLLGETIIGDAQLLALYKRVTAAIRQVDRNHVIIYEGNYMARTFDLFTALPDSNAMLSFHDYPWAFPGQDLTVRMTGYDAAARRLNAPQWAGEFGQSPYDDIQKYVTVFNSDPLVAGWAQYTWKQSLGFPALQTIQHTPASRKLIDWINVPSRPRPTAAEATQGMSDFVGAIRFEETVHDARLRRILAADAPTAPAPAPSAATAPASAPSTPAASSPAPPSPATTAPSRRAGGRTARCRRARSRRARGRTQRSSPRRSNRRRFSPPTLRCRRTRVNASR